MNERLLSNKQTFLLLGKFLQKAQTCHASQLIRTIYPVDEFMPLNAVQISTRSVFSQMSRNFRAKVTAAMAKF